jgi:pimeloyl-ACP methyl ester carboxylesterase
MKPLKFVAAALAALTAVFGLSCQAIQRKALFYPTHDARDNGLAKWSHDGEVIGFAREAAQPRNVWLLLHGNGGQAADRTYALAAFSEADSVFILEYPGYGLRTGKPSRDSIDTAARQAYALLRARFPHTPVCVAAESLGSGPASVLAGEVRPPDKLVFVVPFDNLKSVAAHHVSYLPVGVILAGSWNNVEAITGYRGPVEVFGAERDNVIPVAHAKALAASLPQARFHLIPGGHNDWSHQSAVRFENP